MPDRRTEIVEAGALLLGTQGSDALTARRLAREIGASTMAVYTHFGSMDDLRQAIREDGYARLAAAWGAVERTDDPVADLSVSGASYAAFAFANPHLYRAMFLERALPLADAPLEVVRAGVGFVEACIAAGRFDEVDPWELVWQLWAATHGVVAGVLAGVVRAEAVPERMRALGVSLYVGFGDERRAAARSIDRAQGRLARLGLR